MLSQVEFSLLNCADQPRQGKSRGWPERLMDYILEVPRYFLRPEGLTYDITLWIELQKMCGRAQPRMHDG